MKVFSGSDQQLINALMYMSYERNNLTQTDAAVCVAAAEKLKQLTKQELNNYGFQ